jgi:hypothetical protein
MSLCFLAGTYVTYEHYKTFTPECTVFNPSKEKFASMTNEQCMKDTECILSTHFTLDNLQTITVADIGSQTKNYLSLQKEGYDIYNPKNITKGERYGTVLESLTHGEATISAEPITFTEKDVEDFQKNYSQKDFIVFLRTTFDNYRKGNAVSISNEELTIKCNIVEGQTFGLSGFDPRYYKSKFVPFAVYRHITGGYDVLLFFVDKPDILFRVWISKNKDGAYELKTIKNSGVPKNEVEALYKSFENILKKKQISL